MPPRQLKKSGFTLVELLVVIAVVALLLAVLLPAINQARDVTYKTMCLSNLRQAGAAVANYATGYRNHIPVNAYDADNVSPTKGPYRSVNGGAIYQWEASNYLRFDKGTGQTFTYSGMGLLLATDYIPYSMAGLRVFWCPAECNFGIAGSSPTNGAAGPAKYWNMSERYRWSGLGDVAKTYGSYSYRSLGALNNVMVNVPSPQNKITSQSWDINFYPRRALIIDTCINVEDVGTTARFSHYGKQAYQGYNRLFIDGSANWMRDPDCLWRTYLPGMDTANGNFYQTTWIVADTLNM